MLDNTFDRAVLARSIPALHDDQDLVIAFDEVTLQLDQFDLEFAQSFLVSFLRNRRRVSAGVWFFTFLAHSYLPISRSSDVSVFPANRNSNYQAPNPTRAPAADFS